MSTDSPTSKTIIIDTTSYAGNFEREMCAYMTGQYGECGIGAELAADARREIVHLEWWRSHIAQEADEHGCRRPASIWRTPGWFGNGMGGVYRDDPSTYDKARADAAESAKAYYAKQNEMCQRRLEQNDFEDGPGGGGWTKDACIRTLKSNEDWIRRVSESDVRYPAHLSVAVFVDGIPPAEVLDEMKRRAEYFARNYGSISRRFLGIGKESIEVTGFRFVEPESRLVEHTI